jgi:predicted permease
VLTAVVLATGAALLVRTVGELRAIDWGIEPAGVLTADIIMAEDETTEAERARFFEALLERVEGLPGVRAAGLINRVPVRDGGWQATIALADRPDLTGDRRPNAYYRPVTPNTFAALGIEVVDGRGIRPSDTFDATRVAVVNEAFARAMFPGESAVGRIIDDNGMTSDPIEIVGTIRDVAVDDLVGDVPMAAYYPWAQTLAGAAYGIVVVKTELDPVDLTAPIRALVQELDPRAAVGRTQTMESVVDEAMAEPLRLRFFLAMFSALGIVLGTVGVYGVVSQAVQRRSTEFGIRLALGAAPGRLLREVVRHGMLPVLIGVAGGTVVALLGSTVLAGFLFEVEPTDPVSVLAASGALLVAGALAALVPAWRASATDPAVSLRAE